MYKLEHETKPLDFHSFKTSFTMGFTDNELTFEEMYKLYLKEF